MKKLFFPKKLLSLFISVAMAFALMPAFSISAFAVTPVTSVSMNMPNIEAGMSAIELSSALSDIVLTCDPDNSASFTNNTPDLVDVSTAEPLESTESYQPGEVVILRITLQPVAGFGFDESSSIELGSYILPTNSPPEHLSDIPEGTGYKNLIPAGKYFCFYAYKLPYDTHSITKSVLPQTGGSFTATVNGTEVTEAAAEDTVRLLPSANSGFAFESFTVVGGTGQIPVTPVDGGQPNEYAFTMPDEDVQINCNFEPAETAEYTIVEGQDVTIDLSNLKDVVFRSDAPFELFQGVTIDENLLTYDTDYTATSGSTIVTVKANTFKNLTPGKHELTIWSEDGHASTTFDVVENAGASGATKTGDSAIYLLALLALCAICTSTVTAYRIRKKD